VKRVFPGFYQGETVRAEKHSDGWHFDVRGRQLGVKVLWIEYHPAGHWCSIGSWKTREAGLSAYERLRSGTHFWDADLNRCRLYDADTYAEIRGD
jgi:hypothetical protein